MKRPLLITVVNALLLPIYPAFGQGMLEEVIVTAQKREQNLQDIPLAISAFGAEDLKNMNAVDFRDLSTRLSNVNISNDQSNLDIAIRGVSNNRGFAPATAFHIDGIYSGQGQTGMAAFLDVARVEVLRGPQGTLYGRNATAGAVNVITTRPNFDEMAASIEITAGNYDRTRLEAIGNLPLIENQLAARVALMQEERDGYSEHGGLGIEGPDSDDADNSGGKIRLQWMPNDKIDWMLGYDFVDQQGAGPRLLPDADRIIPLDDLYAQTDDFLATFLLPRLQPGTALSNLPADIQRKIKSDPRFVPVTYDGADDPAIVAANRIDDDTEQTAFLTELNVDLDVVQLTFLAGVRELEQERLGDNDYWAGNRISSSMVDAKETSYELRIAQTKDNFDWLLGLYYYTNDRKSYFDAGAAVGYGTESTSRGVFTHGSYSVSDTVRLTAGVRYSEDESDDSDLLNPGSPETHVDFDHTSWKLAVEWDAGDNSLIYGSVSTGYKTGGLNSGSQTMPEFDKETLLAYEIGSKNRFMDGRLQLNGSLFYYEYSDLQVSGFEVIFAKDENGDLIPDPSTPGNFVTESVNSANANIEDTVMYGAELEWVALVTDNFQIDGGIGLLETEVDEGLVDNGAIFGAAPVDVSGNELRKAPPVSFNLGLQYSYTFAGNGATLTTRLDFHYEDEQYHDVLNRNEDREPSYTRTDLSVLYRDAGDRYFVQFFGRNLEDEDVRTLTFQSTAGPLSAFAPPRTYGVRFGFNF